MTSFLPPTSRAELLCFMSQPAATIQPVAFQTVLGAECLLWMWTPLSPPQHSGSVEESVALVYLAALSTVADGAAVWYVFEDKNPAPKQHP